MFERFVNYPSTIVLRNYRDNYENRCCSGSHKRCKTLFVVRFKIISLYLYKDLRLNHIPYYARGGIPLDTLPGK